MRPSTKLARSLTEGCAPVIRLQLNVHQVEIVNRLYATGLWGNSPTKVVERLLCEAMQGHALPESGK